MVALSPKLHALAWSIFLALRHLRRPGLQRRKVTPINTRALFHPLSTLSLCTIAAIWCSLVLAAPTEGRGGPARRPDPQLFHLSRAFAENDLALVFLTNAGRLDRSTQNALSASGVAHYVAVSAGQIAPVINALLWVARRTLIALLGSRAAVVSRLLLPVLLARAPTVATCLCFFLVALYSTTGSLLRIAVLQYLCLSIACHFVFRLRPPTPTSLRFLVAVLPSALLVVLALAFKRNLLNDWSFLYASAGALGCTLAARVCQAFLGGQHQTLRALLAQMVCTQLICTSLFWPLHPIHPGSALIANALAGPLVTWGIVPTTLFLTIGSKAGLVTPGGTLATILVTPADKLLGAFRFIAETAAALPVPWGSLTLLQAFSSPARVYLQVLALAALVAASWSAVKPERSTCKRLS